MSDIKEVKGNAIAQFAEALAENADLLKSLKPDEEKLLLAGVWRMICSQLALLDYDAQLKSLAYFKEADGPFKEMASSRYDVLKTAQDVPKFRDPNSQARYSQAMARQRSLELKADAQNQATKATEEIDFAAQLEAEIADILKQISTISAPAK